jgi:hypothetical protein
LPYPGRLMNGVQSLIAVNETYIGNEDKNYIYLLLVCFRSIKLFEVVYKEQLYDFHLHNITLEFFFSLFSPNATTCPLWTSCSPHPVVAEV